VIATRSGFLLVDLCWYGPAFDRKKSAVGAGALWSCGEETSRCNSWKSKRWALYARIPPLLSACKGSWASLRSSPT